MRNGNLISYKEPTKPFPSFYLTYEEWKPFKTDDKSIIIHGFYLTYEEWKLGYPVVAGQNFVGFYLTYEEWKLPTYGYLKKHLEGFYLTYEEWKHANCTVPICEGVQFLPYL